MTAKSIRHPLHCRAHHDMTTLGTRNSAFQKHQTTLRINTDNLKILLSARHRTHVTRHTLARKHSTRILRHSDGARNIVRTGVTVVARCDLKLWRLMVPAKAFAPGSHPSHQPFVRQQTPRPNRCAQRVLRSNISRYANSRFSSPASTLPWHSAQPRIY